MLTYAQVHFGMGWDEVKELTPRYFDALVRAREIDVEIGQRHADWMLAQIVAMTANTGFRGWKDARQPQEFLPKYASDDAPKAVKKRRKSRAQIANDARKAMHAIFGVPGKDY